jgi:hypothetical protein
MWLSPTRKLLISPTCRWIMPRLLPNKSYVSASCLLKQKCLLHVSNTTTIAQMCRVQPITQVKPHCGQDLWSNLANLTKSNSSATSWPLGRPLTCRVSGIDNLGTDPPKSASIRPVTGFCARPKINVLAGALHLSGLIDKHVPKFDNLKPCYCQVRPFA